MEISTECAMQRGSATAVGGTAFFNPGTTNTIYAYENYSQDWYELPSCPHHDFTIVAVDDLLTAVGGSQQKHTPGNTLLSFSKGEWTAAFPTMSTQRSSPAAICVRQCLLVAGGCSGEEPTSVEIMNTDTQQWSTATTSLTDSLSYDGRVAMSASLSMAACRDKIYMFEENRTHVDVYTCSLSTLLQSCQQSSMDTDTPVDTYIWNRLADLPVSQSTAISLCGQLISVGGYDDTGEVDLVYYYDPTTNTWQKMGNLICPKGLPLAVTLPGDKLIVVYSNNNESFIGTSTIVEVS